MDTAYPYGPEFWDEYLTQVQELNDLDLCNDCDQRDWN